MPRSEALLATAGLTCRQKECLALHYYDGLNQEYIARLLGIRQQVVSQHLAYGLRKLAAVRLMPREVQLAPPSMTWMDTETLDKVPDNAILALW